MLAKRIIPCLDVKDGRVVKGIHFVGLQEVGDAVELGRRYALEGADELVYLDISATLEGRNTFAALVSRVAEAVNIPFTVGGGISSLDDASRLLDAGADKITVSRPSDKELFSWAKEAENRGAGEILFTSMDHDGTRNGYPCPVYAALSDSLGIPVIASGGAGSVDDIAAVLTEGKADAALAASIFHYGQYTVGEVKKQLSEMGIPVRL